MVHTVLVKYPQLFPLDTQQSLQDKGTFPLKKGFGLTYCFFGKNQYAHAHVNCIDLDSAVPPFLKDVHMCRSLIYITV